MPRPPKRTTRPKRVLEVSPEDAEKVRRLKEGKKSNVDPEWYFLGEFGMVFGWEGVQAVLDNRITLPEANVLLQAAEKVWFRRVYDQAHATLVAVNAANAKSPSAAFKKGMTDILKKMKVE